MRLSLLSALLTVALLGGGFGSGNAQGLAADVVLQVRGMVCSFCVQGVEKKLLAVPAVEKVVVKLKEKSVYLWLHKGKTATDAQLKTAIESAGYNLENVVRKASPPTTDSPKPSSAVQSELIQ